MIVESRQQVIDVDGRSIVLETNRDVTERRRAESARGQLAALVESSEDAIVGKDLSGIVTSWNHAAERMFGYSAREAIGQSIRLIIPDTRQAEEDDVLARIRPRRDDSTLRNGQTSKERDRNPGVADGLADP